MIDLDLHHIGLRDEGAVTWATIDNPPINLMTRELFIDLLKLGAAAGRDPDLLVLVLQSANPDFFIAHFDVELLVELPVEVPEPVTELTTFDQMCESFRTMPAVTIAKIAGRVGGGGSELAMACDLRYGAVGQAVMNQMEVPLGILPGGGGTQRLPRLVGRSRATELILGGLDLDATTGESWGYFTRALPARQLDEYTDGLARRIAGFPPRAVRAAKEAIVAAEVDIVPGLNRESSLFQQIVATPEARAAMVDFLTRGGQTREVELRIADAMAAGSTDHLVE